MITLSALQLVLAIVAIFGAVFSVYFYFRNPQIKTDQETLKLKEDVSQLRKDITEIKETHLRSVEGDVRKLNENVANLNIAIAKLTTIIDERIPRSTPTLTPPVK